MAAVARCFARVEVASPAIRLLQVSTIEQIALVGLIYHVQHNCARGFGLFFCKSLAASCNLETSATDKSQLELARNEENLN